MKASKDIINKILIEELEDVLSTKLFVENIFSDPKLKQKYYQEFKKQLLAENKNVNYKNLKLLIVGNF